MVQNTFQRGQRDDEGRETKLKLTQLNWPGEVVRTVDMLNNKAMFETKLSAFPVAAADMDKSVASKLALIPAVSASLTPQPS